jgi:A/G-specific adenine glycosylase
MRLMSSGVTDSTEPSATVTVALDTEAVLVWSDQAWRDLPWRRTRDPWAILVSETMLQQTQVIRVVPRYLKFLERFPTPVSCARSSLADVVRQWEGLGYNRRAGHLHQAASTIVEAGQFPDDLAGLLALPGVGPYTARAVLVFAYEQQVGVLDTNVARILARTAGRSLRPKEAQVGADILVPRDRSWEWNQAMLDLGATVCRARAPRCGDCPVGATCEWFQLGRPEPDPAVGSAGVSGKQSRFEGSDRQGRGRLIAALRRGPVAADQVAEVMGWPDDLNRSNRVAATLVVDGLVVRNDDHLSLPAR